MASNAPSQARLLPSLGTTNAATATDIRDVKPPVAIPAGALWLVVLLIALVVACGAYFGWRRWRRKSTAAAPEIIVPPRVRARDRLRAALEFIHQPEPFCVAVSAAIRIYLEEEFALHAPDRTTEEFLDELQASPLLSLGQKRLLGDFLARCDLVKFARYDPGEPELRDLYDVAVRLVEEVEPTASTQTSAGTAVESMALVESQKDAPPTQAER